MLNLTNHEVMKIIYWCIAKVLDLLDPEKTNMTQKVISAVSALLVGFLIVYPPGQGYDFVPNEPGSRWGRNVLSGIRHDLIFAHDYIAFKWLLGQIGLVLLVTITLLYLFKSK